MTSILFLSAVGAVAVLFRAVTATHDILPGTLDPFEATGTGDPAADTLCGEEGVKTLPPTGHEWQVCVYRSLGEVESALDSLEACGVAHREVHALANDVFAVRWR